MRGSLTISEATQRSKRSYAACFKSKADRMPSTSANPSTGLQYDVKMYDLAKRVEKSPLKMVPVFRVHPREQKEKINDVVYKTDALHKSTVATRALYIRPGCRSAFLTPSREKYARKQDAPCDRFYDPDPSNSAHSKQSVYTRIATTGNPFHSMTIKKPTLARRAKTSAI